MVAVLWEARQLNAALELERLWNVLGSEVPFSLLCGYPAADASDAPAVEEVCRLHDVVTNEPLLDWTAELRFDFPPTADSVRAARRRAAAELRRLGREELCEAAVVIVSELATNAVLHARSPFTLILSPQATGVRIAVRDGAPAPAVGEFDSAAATGRGLRLVKALAARTGMEPCGDGKVFFAELDT
jgi:anti-sigma regulatory factor (Ser/Thr protein kinase)